MIKKLRRRIVMINMLLIGAVILTIIVIVNVNNYSNSVNMMERGMNQVFDKNGRDFSDSPPEQLNELTPDSAMPEDKGFKPDGNDPGNKRKFDNNTPIQISSYVIVEVDESGKIVSTTENDLTIDSETLEKCVKSALDSSKIFGQINDEGLMYLKKSDMAHSKIIFADNSFISGSLRTSVIISALLLAGAMAVIFLISLWLSGLAVKPVKKAWEQQKQFVADASHELKTPLTVILANNNIMMSHKDSTVADERQWLESTEEEANHMKKLIDNMLFLAKSDAGETKVQLSTVDFSEIAEACALNFEPVAFEKEIMTDAQIESGITLNGDATQLNQLAHILVDNAVKYADSGTTVTIRLQKHGDRVEFSVNNKGNPIPKEDIEHIFDRFYRAEKSRTTKGYGLGLSIARRITEGMNGKILVESNKENGTTFTVRF